MRKWPTFPHQEGITSRQAHTKFPEEGIYEREVSRSGFFGPATQFHHKNPPTGWSNWEGPHGPRAFDLNKLEQPSDSPWSALSVLSNASCKMRMWRCTSKMDYLAANSDGDDLFFIHEGGGELYCDYGHMTLNTGDYVMMPRNTRWRLEPTSPMMVLMIEATNDYYQLPDKGLLGPQAIFDPAMLDVPAIDEAFKAQQTDEPWRILAKRQEDVSTITYPYNPLDAVGWHGEVSVLRINWRDIRPLMSHRYHLPPSAHTTFMAGQFVVCTFVPRPFESDPDALKLPFYHNNDDYDEVLFYHQGDFFSRDNIHPGMVTFHPTGFTHGPHPKAFRASMENVKTETDEVAVMLDTRAPLKMEDLPPGVEWTDYVNSWKEK